MQLWQPCSIGMKKRQSELKLVMRPLPHPSDSQMGLSCGICCQALPRRRRSRKPALSPRMLALGCTTTTTLHGYESKLDPGGSAAQSWHTEGRVFPLSTAERTLEEKTGAKGLYQPALESVYFNFRAPRDPAASSRPCLLCMSCTCFVADCAGRCPPLTHENLESFMFRRVSMSGR